MVDIDNALADRVGALEIALDDARREIARIEVDLAASVARANAYRDLVEQRIDTIYRQIIFELKRAFDLGKAVIETESDVDDRLAKMFSAGLDAPVDVAKLALASVLSGTLEAGTIAAPLTLYGFRINRERARERGDRIEILPSSVGGEGSAVYGPYKRLAPGAYTVTAHVRRVGASASSPAPTGGCALDVFSPGLGAVLGASDINGADLTSLSAIAVDFEWTAASAGDVIEIRLHQRSSEMLELTHFTLADRNPAEA